MLANSCIVTFVLTSISVEIEVPEPMTAEPADLERLRAGLQATLMLPLPWTSRQDPDDALWWIITAADGTRVGRVDGKHMIPVMIHNAHLAQDVDCSCT